MRSSLTTKIGVVVLAASLLSASAAALVAYLVTADILAARTLDDLGRGLRLCEERLRREIERLDGQMDRVAQVLANTPENAADGNPAACAHLAALVAPLFGAAEPPTVAHLHPLGGASLGCAIRIVDGRGFVVAAGDQSREDMVSSAAGLGGAARQLSLFVEEKATGTASSHLVAAARVQRSAGPVRLVLERSITGIVHHLSELLPYWIVPYVVDGGGAVHLGAPVAELPGRSQQGAASEGQAPRGRQLAALAREALRRPGGSEVETAVFAAPLAATDHEGNAALVAVIRADEKAPGYAPAPTALRAAGFVAALAFVATAVASLVVGRLVRPLRYAAAVADRIRGGEREIAIEARTTDESGHLLRAMAEMLDAIHETERELKQSHAELERRVAERTAALSAANERLKREISERAAAEASLRRQGEFITAVLDTAGALVVVLDASGRIVRFNRQCEKVTGFDASEVANKRPWELLSATEHATEDRSLFNNVVGGDYPQDSESAWMDKKGGRHLVAWSHTALTDNRGVVEYVIQTGLDRTERRALEEQYRHSQRMEAIGRIASGVAHDFNNLIAIVLGFSDIVLRQLAPDTSLYHQVEEIKNSANRAATLTRQLLVFSRKQPLQPRSLDLNHVVAAMEKLLRRVIGEDVDLLTAPADELWLVRADAGSIEQVIINLAINARDAMPKGGKLTLETANVTLDGDYSRLHLNVVPGQYVMLAVSDSGTGMDGETLKHIFEPFFTTKEGGKGTGLGLSTVYGIVMQSGGHVCVYSEVERGTTFKIYLPRSGRPDEISGVTAPASRSGGSETILLVEDEVTLRKLIRNLLSREGYTILEALTSEEAIALSDHYPEQIHLLLTDVVMPDLSGPEVAEQLRKRRSALKVLYISGYPGDAIVHHGFLDSKMNFLPKPFTAELLAGRVREVLDS
ncbi:MAG: response regulator [Candidatus Schekmanbacteria bacterium]|nr:response regulator [Candidatus Schekmanbacteria bacterium]